MQQIQMYALYDKKAQLYDTPVFFLKKVQAERWFFSLCKAGEGRFENFQEDMELHKILEFNIINGNISKNKIENVMQGTQIKLEKGKE
jgi:hypothetical protein